MNSKEFIETLRVINCMENREYKGVLPEWVFNHVMEKKRYHGIAFLFHLDEVNLESIIEYANSKLNKEKATN